MADSNNTTAPAVPPAPTSPTTSTTESKEGNKGISITVRDTSAPKAGPEAISTSVSGSFTPQALADAAAAFASSAQAPLANVIPKFELLESVVDRHVLTTMNHVYSHPLERECKATSQKSSGRCWLFAGCNVLRLPLVKALKLDDSFELSQTYLFFYDKLERANWFFNNAVSTASAETNSREIAWLFGSELLSDGGQWDMFASLILKYGIVPKSAYPESYHSSSSRRMNWLLKHKVREMGVALRRAARDGASAEQLGSMKDGFLKEVYTILAVCLGVPPTSFDWTYKPKGAKTGTTIKGLTPLAFYNKYIPVAVEDKVSLIHGPTADKAYNTHYTVRHLGNIVGGRRTSYVNVDVDTLGKAVVDSLCAGQPVWFGCDVNKHFYRKGGFQDMTLMSSGYKSTFGTSFSLDKASRLDYHDSLATHAMVFTAFDAPEGTAPGSFAKLRVENSWGSSSDSGDSGYLAMSRNWFDEYVYQIVVDKAVLTPELLAVAASEPKELEPWDPFGNLACASCSSDDTVDL